MNVDVGTSQGLIFCSGIRLLLPANIKMLSEIMDKVLEKLRLQRMVCPWWCCYTFDNPLRRLLHNPEAILSPCINPGSTVIDVGAGMGYFSIPLARLVGPGGHVTAIDIQAIILRTNRRLI